MKRLKRLWRLFSLWRMSHVRNWVADDHSDCLSFMGPCNQCRDRQEYVRLKNPPTEVRLVGGGWTPRKRRVHSVLACQSHSWCHECDDLRPPCCDECIAFGPCTQCTDDYVQRAEVATDRCLGRCGDDACGLPWVGPRWTGGHFDTPTKSCYDYGCTDDCPVAKDA